MKFRTDFITNSSSSSYICVVCGEEEHSWDTPDWIKSCIQGHYFCEEHLKNIDEEELYCEDGDIKDIYCPVCSFNTYADDEMVKYLQKVYKVDKDVVFAKVKEKNKRRRKLYDSEYISYVFDEFNLTEDKIMEEIRGKFKDWSEYYDFI